MSTGRFTRETMFLEEALAMPGAWASGSAVSSMARYKHLAVYMTARALKSSITNTLNASASAASKIII